MSEVQTYIPQVDALDHIVEGAYWWYLDSHNSKLLRIQSVGEDV